MLLKNFSKDLYLLKKEHNISSRVFAIVSNRGLHSLFVYRLSNSLWKKKIPILPLIFTRFIQILYAIDIDYRARLEGGILIVHGFGIVIGKGVQIESGTKIYQGVTLGIKGIERNDGFPSIGHNVTLCAGAKLFGNIKVGSNCVIGSNVVLTKSLKENRIIKLTTSCFEIKIL